LSADFGITNNRRVSYDQRNF